jgi:hypothetical protein
MYCSLKSATFWDNKIRSEQDALHLTPPNMVLHLGDEYGFEINGKWQQILFCLYLEGEFCPNYSSFILQSVQKLTAHIA